MEKIMKNEKIIKTLLSIKVSITLLEDTTGTKLKETIINDIDLIVNLLKENYERRNI
jgi:hypothetical protein